MVEGLEEEVEVEEADSEAMLASVEFTNASLADPEIDLKGSVPLVAAGPIVTRLVPPVIGNEEHAPLVEVGTILKQEPMRSKIVLVLAAEMQLPVRLGVWAIK